jgi:hypothetical protein
MIFKHRSELENFKRNIIHPFKYTSDLPSACISREKVNLIFRDININAASSEESSHPVYSSVNEVSDPSFSKVKLSHPPPVIIDDNLKSSSEYTYLSSFLPPIIQRPFLYPHSPLVPCNSACDIVHFFKAPGNVYVQVVSHTLHHRYFPSSIQTSKKLLKKEFKEKKSLRNTGFISFSLINFFTYFSLF